MPFFKVKSSLYILLAWCDISKKPENSGLTPQGDKVHLQNATFLLYACIHRIYLEGMKHFGFVVEIGHECKLGQQ